nr:immunoglobulin light chain junction region [Macaca mulatta]
DYYRNSFAGHKRLF